MTNHGERGAYERRIDPWVRVACVFAPAIPFAPIWTSLRDAIGMDGAALLGIVTQMFLVVVVAPRITAGLSERRYPG